jgi:hypothetical protein
MPAAPSCLGPGALHLSMLTFVSVACHMVIYIRQRHFSGIIVSSACRVTLQFGYSCSAVLVLWVLAEKQGVTNAACNIIATCGTAHYILLLNIPYLFTPVVPSREQERGSMLQAYVCIAKGLPCFCWCLAAGVSVRPLAYIGRSTCCGVAYFICTQTKQTQHASAPLSIFDASELS